MFVKACQEQIDILKASINDEEANSKGWLGIRTDSSNADTIAHKHGVVCDILCDLCSWSSDSVGCVTSFVWPLILDVDWLVYLMRHSALRYLIFIETHSLSPSPKPATHPPKKKIIEAHFVSELGVVF